MINLLLDAFSVAFVFLTFYFVMLGRKYEDEVEKHAINFFMLGLMFLALRIIGEVAAEIGVRTALLSTPLTALFSILVPLCFVIGLSYVKDTKEEAEEATEKLKETEKFMKIVKKK